MSTIRAAFAIALTALLSSVGSLSAAAAPAASNSLDPLAFLLGSWDAGANTGAHGTGTGATTFERSLQGRVIVRTNHADYPALGDRPATKHDDLMVIYAHEDGAEADYYDNEGHKIHYVISTPAANHVVFLGDAPAGAPRFRLTYSRRDDSTVDGEFEMAPPGHPETFQRYLTWEMHRTGDAARP